MLASESRSAVATDVETWPVMRWGAIFGGWLVATGVASMLYVAGLAMGFSALDPNNAEAAAKGIGLGAAGWMVLTWAISLFLGGMFASWFDGRSDQTMGALHGVTVWGLAVTASGLLLALGVAQGIQGGAALAGGMAPKMQMAQRGSPASGSQPAADATSASATPGAQAQPAPRTPTPSEAEAAKRYTAAAMWIAFISTFVALIASAIGGWMGARHIHRVYHLRRYEGRTVAAR